MKLRQPSSRWALWVFAAALLLKAAMPWLATASAQVQGKALAEVCTVYGLALVPPGSAAPTSEPHPPDHGGGDCALAALPLLALLDLPVIAALPVRPGPVSLLRAHRTSAPRDASATWIARRKHGPPAVA